MPDTPKNVPEKSDSPDASREYWPGVTEPERPESLSDAEIDAAKAHKVDMQKFFGVYSPSKPDADASKPSEAVFADILRFVKEAGGGNQKEQPSEAELVQNYQLQELEGRLAIEKQTKTSRMEIIMGYYTSIRDRAATAYQHAGEVYKKVEAKRNDLEFTLQLAGYTKADSENPKGYGFDGNGHLLAGPAPRAVELVGHETQANVELAIIKKETAYAEVMDEYQHATSVAEKSADEEAKAYVLVERVRKECDENIQKVERAIAAKKASLQKPKN